MADIGKRLPDCDDCEGERGERGERGKRGHRGHRGHDGSDGSDGSDGGTGPTGPTGSTGPTGTTGSTGSTGPFGGPTPEGIPNTQAYFGFDGMLTSDPDATMTLSGWSLNKQDTGEQALNVNRDLRSAAIGDGSVASGLRSFASGEGSVASGLNAFAAGMIDPITLVATTASGDGGHAEGCGTVASGDCSHAEGRATQATGVASHAEGSNTDATGTASHAEGLDSVASGPNSHAEGEITVASGENAHAEGEDSVASGADSHAQGRSAVALRFSQDAMASGQFAARGDAQTSVLVLRGSTPGAVVGEPVELFFGEAPLQLILEDGRGYNIMVTAILRGRVGGLPLVRSIRQMFAVRRDAGLTTIAAAGAQENIGDAGAASWTLTASVGAAPDRFALTATTGATTTALRVAAKVEFTEVLNP